MTSKTYPFAGALFVLLSTGCQKAPIIDTEHQPYVDDFYAEGSARKFMFQADRPSVQFVDQIASTTNEKYWIPLPGGLCSQNGVEIKRSFWPELSEMGKKFLIFHELGHCVLKRDHEFSEFLLWTKPVQELSLPYKRTVPSSIMSGDGWVSDEDLQLLWNDYMEELFNGKMLPAFSLELSDEQLTALREHWRGLIEPAVRKFEEEAKKRGKNFPPLTLSFEKPSQPETGIVSVQDIHWFLANLKSPDSDAVEFAVFGWLANLLDPRTDYQYTVEVRDGQSFPSSMRVYFYLLGNPALADYYRERRERYLQDLFQVPASAAATSAAAVGL